MKVKNKIFYHIARNKNFEIGQELFFGEENNGQNKIFDFSFNQNDIPLHEIAFKKSKNGILNDKKANFKFGVALSNYDLFMREIALENVRAEKFSNLPSRFKCMYLFDDKEEMLQQFYSIKKSNKSSAKLQALSIEVTGEAFYVKDVFISREGLSFNEYKQRAKEFWGQNQKSNKKTKEVLFIGKAKIIEILY